MPSRTRSQSIVSLIAGLWVLLTAEPVEAQQSSGPPPSTPPPVALTPYRPPALALVQPAAGGSVPQDRPVVVFRFAPGEPNDPTDPESFAVTVDGEDRVSLFQISSNEAWGPLAASRDGGGPSISVGAHQVVARLCSERGVCAEVVTTVTVAPAATASDKPVEERRKAVIRVLLDAARKLLNP
jgi:hypothetical protein